MMHQACFATPGIATQDVSGQLAFWSPASHEVVIRTLAIQARPHRFTDVGHAVPGGSRWFQHALGQDPSVGTACTSAGHARVTCSHLRPKLGRKVLKVPSKAFNFGQVTKRVHRSQSGTSESWHQMVIHRKAPSTDPAEPRQEIAHRMLSIYHAAKDQRTGQSAGLTAAHCAQIRPNVRGNMHRKTMAADCKR